MDVFEVYRFECEVSTAEFPNCQGVFRGSQGERHRRHLTHSEQIPNTVIGAQPLAPAVKQPI